MPTVDEIYQTECERIERELREALAKERALFDTARRSFQEIAQEIEDKARRDADEITEKAWDDYQEAVKSFEDTHNQRCQPFYAKASKERVAAWEAYLTVRRDYPDWAKAAWPPCNLPLPLGQEQDDEFDDA